jgi:hypothetical protein
MMKEKLVFFVYKNIMLKTRRLIEAVNIKIIIDSPAGN